MLCTITQEVGVGNKTSKEGIIRHCKLPFTAATLPLDSVGTSGDDSTNPDDSLVHGVDVLRVGGR